MPSLHFYQWINYKKNSPEHQILYTCGTSWLVRKLQNQAAHPAEKENRWRNQIKSKLMVQLYCKCHYNNIKVTTQNAWLLIFAVIFSLYLSQSQKMPLTSSSIPRTLSFTFSPVNAVSDSQSSTQIWRTSTAFYGNTK